MAACRHVPGASAQALRLGPNARGMSSRARFARFAAQQAAGDLAILSAAIASASSELDCILRLALGFLETGLSRSGFTSREISGGINGA
jgi:hypothetical protein